METRVPGGNVVSSKDGLDLVRHDMQRDRRVRIAPVGKWTKDVDDVLIALHLPRPATDSGRLGQGEFKMTETRHNIIRLPFIRERSQNVIRGH